MDLPCSLYDKRSLVSTYVNLEEFYHNLGYKICHIDKAMLIFLRNTIELINCLFN